MNHSRRLANTLLLFALLGVGTLLLPPLIKGVQENQKHELERRLADNLHAITHGVNRWYLTELDNTLDWCYPPSLKNVVDKGLLPPNFPVNPISKEPMRELGPSDRNSLGDFRYVATQVRYELSDGTAYVAHERFYLIMYVDWTSEQSKLSDRLGKTRVFVDESGIDRRIPRRREDLSPKMLKVYDMVVSREYETLDQALTRLGYP